MPSDEHVDAAKRVLETFETETQAAGNNGSEPLPDMSPPSNAATVPPEPVPAVPPPIATSRALLADFSMALHSRGVVGEDRFAKVTYLCLTSRVLGRPVSLAAKGPSSAGKSFVVQEVVEFFPESAVYALSSMSEHALAYSKEPLSHRFLVLYEAAGLESDFASYLLRSLLSEGCIRYETVEKVKGAGLQPRLIEREGPTGLIVTTTQVSLHPENETRLLSVPANDTPQQTAAIIKMLACEDGRHSDGDLAEWRTLQAWINAQDNRVTIPFAPALADLVPPVAVRLRRDFSTVLNLVKAHAVLHQQTRERDDAGRIVATVEDYGVVRDLIADLVADEVGATVPATVVETVTAVDDLSGAHKTGVTYLQLGERLGLDKSAARRRAKVATSRGYLKNLEDKRGQPARLVVGEPLPGEVTILPTVETLTGGTVAVRPEGRDTNGRESTPSEVLKGSKGAHVLDVATFDTFEPEAVEPVVTFGEHRQGDDPSKPDKGIAIVRQAAEIVVNVGAASSSLLMKRLGLYEAESESLLDRLERAGIVGPLEGKARPVLVESADIERLIAAYESRRTRAPWAGD